jgi:hypothetical protein
MDLQGQDELTEDQMVEEISGGYVHEVMDGIRWPDIPREATEDERKRLMDEYNQKIDARSRQYYERQPLRKLHCFRFSYCDNDGTFESNMEHGEIFRRLPHVRISNH